MVKTYRLQNLDCANCAAKVERAVNKVGGVNSASVNFFAQKMTLDIDDDRFETVFESVLKVCRKVEPDMSVKR